MYSALGAAQTSYQELFKEERLCRLEFSYSNKSILSYLGRKAFITRY